MNRKRPIPRRMSVIAVDRLDHTRFLFLCEKGHQFWEKQFVKVPKRQPMSEFQANFYANYWRPGQGCTGRCAKCEKAAGLQRESRKAQ